MAGANDKARREIVIARWVGLLLSLTILAFSIAVSLLLISGRKQGDWPQLLNYILTNPAVLAAIGTLVVFLTIERFRDLSGRVNDIGKQVYDVRTSLERDVKTASEAVSEELSAEWDRVRNKLESVKRENPWLDSISQFEFSVNVPTTGAALRNIEQFLASNDPHIAYEILYEAGHKTYDPRIGRDKAIEGYSNDFEVLAIIALTMFSDAYLCERLLARAEENATPYASVWKARRLLFTLLNDQLATAGRLANDLEADLRPTFFRGLLTRIGFRTNLLPRDDYVEAIAALSVHDHYMENRRAHRRRPWLAAEEAGLPAWGGEIVAQGARLLADEPSENGEFSDLAADPRSCSSVVLLEAQRLMKSGDSGKLVKYAKRMASGRPGLAMLQREARSDMGKFSHGGGLGQPRRKRDVNNGRDSKNASARGDSGRRVAQEEISRGTVGDTPDRR
jgi:hypothetical protein